MSDFCLRNPAFGRSGGRRARKNSERALLASPRRAIEWCWRARLSCALVSDVRAQPCWCLTASSPNDSTSAPNAEREPAHSGQRGCALTEMCRIEDNGRASRPQTCGRAEVHRGQPCAIADRTRDLPGAPCLSPTAAPTPRSILVRTGFVCGACRATCEFCSSGTLPDGSYVSCDDRPQSSCTSWMNPFWSNDTVPPLRRTGFCADRLAGTPELSATSAGRGKWKGDETRGLIFEDEDDARTGGHSSGGRGALHSALDHRRSGALGWRAVKRCLANKTVVFVGDSNMRYQYLALSHYLHTGRWDSWPRSGLPKRRFSVCNENSYPYITVNGTLTRLNAPGDPLKWKGYYDKAAEALGNNELCECRKDLEMENRWYSEGELRVGFAWFTSMAEQTSLMRAWPAWDGVADKCRCAGCSHTSLYPPKPKRLHILNASSFVKQRLAPLRPSAVLFGPGAWVQGSRDDAAFMSGLRLTMGRIKDAVGPSGQAIFRTCLRGQHTHRRGGLGCGNTAGCDEPYRTIAREADWGVLDAQLITDALHEYLLDRQGTEPNRTLLEKKQHRSSRDPATFPAYLDPMHVSCDVYRELNLRLLSRLCPAGEIHSRRERRTAMPA